VSLLLLLLLCCNAQRGLFFLDNVYVCAVLDLGFRAMKKKSGVDALLPPSGYSRRVLCVMYCNEEEE
jgi:hypothetical protein